MKLRLLIIVLVFGLGIGLTAQSAKAGPPWPAVVIITDNIAITDWLADDLTTQTWIMGETKTVYQPHNGNWTVTAQGRMDYDLWEYASLEQLCAPDSPYAFLCNSDGTIMVPHGMFWCMSPFGDWTTNAMIVANRSGQWHLTCQFNGAGK